MNMFNFFHAGGDPSGRDTFMKRALTNMPRINPADYRPSDSVISTHDLELLSPYASPNIPVYTVGGEKDPFSFYARYMAPVTTLKTETEKEENEKDEEEDEEEEAEQGGEEATEEGGEKAEVAVKEEQRHHQDEEEEYRVMHVEDQLLWAKVPRKSSSEKVRQLRREWKKDRKLCRECADTFCRHETFGDRHLISCAQCRDKYHSFCAYDYKKGHEFVCTKCSKVDKVPKLVPVSGSGLHCQLCKQDKTGGFEGRWIGPIGNVPGADPTYVHENCAFYSKGVVKINDQWCRVQSAIRDCHLARCAFCDQKGASVPCDFSKCRKMFHYACVKKQFCVVADHPDMPQHLYCAPHYDHALKAMYEASESSSSSTTSSLAGSPVSPSLFAQQMHHHQKKTEDVIHATSVKLEETSPKRTPRKRRVEETSEEEGEEELGEDGEPTVKLPRLSRDHNFPSVPRLAEWEDRYNAVREEGYKKRVQKWESKIRCTYRKLKDITGQSPIVMKELNKIATEMENKFPALTVDNTVRLKAGGGAA